MRLSARLNYIFWGQILLSLFQVLTNASLPHLVIAIVGPVTAYLARDFVARLELYRECIRDLH